MAYANPSMAAERHLAAARWERCRAAYFQRTKKPDNATKCKLLAMHHTEQARQAVIEASLAK